MLESIGMGFGFGFLGIIVGIIVAISIFLTFIQAFWFFARFIFIIVNSIIMTLLGLAFLWVALKAFEYLPAFFTWLRSF